MAGTDTLAGLSHEAASTARAEPTIRRAALVGTVAGTLGIIGQLLFYDVALGVNYPIAIGLLLLAGWLVRGRTPSLAWRDGWLAPAAVVFAAFVAVRADTTIVMLDVLASVALAGAALVALAGRAVVTRPLGELFALATQVAGWAAAGGVPVVRQARRRLPSGRRGMERLQRALPVVRGLLIAVPIVLVFVALFTAADAVFARAVEDLLEIDVDLGEIFGRATVAAALAWAAAGALALVASDPPVRGTARPAAEREATGWWRVGAVEGITVITAVDLLFAAFVVLQAAYLFGGRDTLAETGLTYSEYARRGFFELVAAAVLAGGLVVALDRTVRRRAVALVAASVALALMTCAVLASATLRLSLYQEAYGWTELRLYVLATIALLAVGLLALVVTLVTDRVRWIGHLLVAAALIIGLGLNLIGPARFIAEQNVARVEPELVPEHGRSGIDASYALTLGDDAVPALLRALPHLPDDQAAYVRAELRIRLAGLRLREELNAWQAWNAGRTTAGAELERAAERGALDER